VRKRHIVVLSEAERARLHTMIGRGVAPASALTHARILLKANQGEAGPGWTDAAIAVAVEVNPLPWPGSAWATSRRGWTPPWTANCPRASTAAGWTGSRRPPGRVGVQRAAGRAQALEVAAAGRPAGGAGARRVGVVRDGSAGLKQTSSSRG
jgi:hypothetical protein